MKALLINGSPRPNGCTFTALTELANTLEAEGIETEIVHVGNKDILPPLPQHRLQQVRL